MVVQWQRPYPGKALCRNAYARLRQGAESVFLVQHIRHFAVHTNDDNQRPAVKRRELILQGLGRWVIDLSLDRFEGIEKIIARREEDDPMALRVLMVNEACAVPSTDTAEACHKERWTHLSL